MKGILYMKDEMILFKCLAGSYLYGTNSENSDKDYKGVFLPNINDLILGKAPKHYTSTTGSINERNSSDDIDETYYSLHYFLELAAKGDTNAIDILFAYTNKDAVIIDTPIWNKIIENIDKILTKNVKAYLDALTDKKNEKPEVTDNGKLILKYLQTAEPGIYKAKDIAEGLFVSSRNVSGAIRKLVTDGFVDKVGESPVLYTITEKGKNYTIED